jgi:hypothetical protein
LATFSLRKNNAEFLSTRSENLAGAQTGSAHLIAAHHGDPAPKPQVLNKVYAAGDLARAKLCRVLPGALFLSAHTGRASTCRADVAE